MKNAKDKWPDEIIETATGEKRITVSTTVAGTPKWATLIATRVVAAKYESEVDMIRVQLMFAYGQGYQDAARSKAQEAKA